MTHLFSFNYGSLFHDLSSFKPCVCVFPLGFYLHLVLKYVEFQVGPYLNYPIFYH